jgi:hypothetical protein
MNLLSWLEGLLFNNGFGRVNMDTSEDIYSADDQERWWVEVGMQQFLMMENEDVDAGTAAEIEGSSKRS